MSDSSGPPARSTAAPTGPVGGATRSTASAAWHCACRDRVVAASATPAR